MKIPPRFQCPACQVFHKEDAILFDRQCASDFRKVRQVVWLMMVEYPELRKLTTPVLILRMWARFIRDKPAPLERARALWTEWQEGKPPKTLEEMLDDSYLF